MMKAFLLGEPRQGDSFVDQDIFCVPERKNATLRCNDNGVAVCRGWKKCPTWKEKGDECPAKPLFRKWAEEMKRRRSQPDIAGMVLRSFMPR